MRCCSLLGVVIATLVGVSLSAELAFAKPTDPRIVRGSVIEETSGAPIASASVVLSTPKTGETVAETVTDEKGRFEFPNVPDGTLSILATKEGYINAGSGGAENVAEIPGGRRQSVTLVLTRPAVIQGRVLNASGLPVRGVKAIALARRAGRAGVRFVPWGSAVGVNERGEYRIFDLMPGRYTVAIVRAPSNQAEVFAPVMFPGVTDAGRAEFFTMRAGETHLNTDIRMVNMALYRIQGQVVGVPGNWSGQRIAVSISAIGGGPFNAGNVFTDEDGRFEFVGVAAGAYQLTANALVREPDTAAPSARRGASRLEVANNVEGIQIIVSKGVTVTGKLLAASSPSELPAATCQTGAAVWLLPENPETLDLRARVIDGGGFVFAEVYPGVYRIAIDTPKSECFVERVIQTGRGDTSGDIVVEGTRGDEELAVFVSSQEGSVTGIVSTADDAPVSNGIVILVPALEAEINKRAAFLRTSTGADGRYAFDRVIPGQYRLIAIKEGPVTDLLDVLDPLAPAMSNASRVELDLAVKGGSETTADLRIRQ